MTRDAIEKNRKLQGGLFILALLENWLLSCGSKFFVVTLFIAGRSTPTPRHMNMVATGYPSPLPNEAHVVSQPTSEVPVSIAAAISMSTAPNSMNGFSGNLPSSVALHSLAVPSSPAYLNGAAC